MTALPADPVEAVEAVEAAAELVGEVLANELAEEMRGPSLERLGAPPGTLPTIAPVSVETIGAPWMPRDLPYERAVAWLKVQYGQAMMIARQGTPTPRETAVAARLRAVVERTIELFGEKGIAPREYFLWRLRYRRAPLAVMLDARTLERSSGWFRREAGSTVAAVHHAGIVAPEHVVQLWRRREEEARAGARNLLGAPAWYARLRATENGAPPLERYGLPVPEPHRTAIMRAITPVR